MYERIRESGKATVVGGGSWGTTVARLLAENLPEVVIWCRDETVAQSINDEHVNEKFLPGIGLSLNITATSDFQNALSHTNLIVWAIPVQYTRERLQACRPHIQPHATIVNLSKGLESKTWYRPSQIFQQECPQVSAIGGLGGGNIAAEVAHGMPAEATLAMAKHWEMSGLELAFSTSSFRVTMSPDLPALELAGALKNIVAIAAGICDGLGVGGNIKGAVVSRGLKEMRVLSGALGANPESLMDSFAMGDLLATCYSPNSRNRSLGESLGRGETLFSAIGGLNGRVAEGIATSNACGELCRRLNLLVPVFRVVEEILQGALRPEELIETVLSTDSSGQTRQAEIPNLREVSR